MMGLPMASRLARRGYVVRGYDPVAERREKLIEAGGLAFDSPSDAVDGCQRLITMLPNGHVVRETLLGGEPCLAGLLARDCIAIDMSSSSPTGTQELAKRLETYSVRLVDAPVSGGVARAQNGSLAIMVGGEAEDVSEVHPLLAALGESIFETGSLGSGHAMKALNNYVSAAGLAAACEAVQIGRRFGLDPEMMIDVLNASTGRNNSTQAKMKPFVLSETYASGFALGLMAKDLRTADDLARSLGVPAPLSKANAALWEAAVKQLGNAADHTEIARFLSSEDAKS